MQPRDILALDIGTTRIGVARASEIARLAEPFTTLTYGENTATEIAGLCRQYDVSTIVVGLPQHVSGDDSEQTLFTREFTSQLKELVPEITITFQDEALSSKRAKGLLKKQKKSYTKSDVDAYAASFILQDFLDRK